MSKGDSMPVIGRDEHDYHEEHQAEGREFDERCGYCRPELVTMPAIERWTEREDAQPLVVCARCGATSNRITTTFNDPRRLWSGAGACHLTRGDESNWVPYVPESDAR